MLSLSSLFIVKVTYPAIPTRYYTPYTFFFIIVDCGFDRRNTTTPQVQKAFQGWFEKIKIAQNVKPRSSHYIADEPRSWKVHDIQMVKNKQGQEMSAEVTCGQSVGYSLDAWTLALPRTERSCLARGPVTRHTVASYPVPVQGDRLLFPMSLCEHPLSPK